VEVLGTDAGEDVSFVRFSIPGFRWLRFASKHAPHHRGASVRGFGIKPFVRQIMRSFQLVKFDSKGSVAKPQEPLSLFSFFRIHLSTSTLRHQQSNQISPTVQSVRVSVSWLGFLCEETPGANLTHPTSCSLGFARGISSSLTSNAFKFGYDMCFR
jgi:hypothetical protein